MYLIYLTNSTRDKIYTVISVKYDNKKLNQLYKELEEIKEDEIFTFRLYYLKPHCKDDIIIGDKYISGFYQINGEKYFCHKI